MTPPRCYNKTLVNRRVSIQNELAHVVSWYLLKLAQRILSAMPKHFIKSGLSRFLCISLLAAKLVSHVLCMQIFFFLQWVHKTQPRVDKSSCRQSFGICRIEQQNPTRKHTVPYILLSELTFGMLTIELNVCQVSTRNFLPTSTQFNICTANNMACDTAQTWHATIRNKG